MKLKTYVALTFLSLFLLGFAPVRAQIPENKDFWIEKYLSVSYPLRKINITSGYGYRKDPFTDKRALHNGLDLQAINEEALSMFDGVVLRAGSDGRSGMYITMQYGAYRVSYCHLSKTLVLPGDTILAGEPIGITGNTGRSTSPHLHLTVKKGEQYINPLELMKYIKEIRKTAFFALVGNKSLGISPEDFISMYAPIAMNQQRKYGIPASVTLAQMAYESGWGQSPLARNGNNFFGIKASRTWIKEGKPYSLHDDDKKSEAFCNYNSALESVEHHSSLLLSDRYKRCRKYSETDYHNWLLSIKAAGYATSSKYVQSCERIIRNYRLYLYDRLALELPQG